MRQYLVSTRLPVLAATAVSLPTLAFAQAATVADIASAGTGGLGDVKGYVIALAVIGMGIAVAFAVWKNSNKGVKRV